MKMWRILIILSLSTSMITPLSIPIAPLQEKMVAGNMIPRLELEDTSGEEQEMLDAFEVKKQSSFLQWVQRIGGSLVSRYTIIKKSMQQTMYQMRGWWRERTEN